MQRFLTKQIAVILACLLTIAPVRAKADAGARTILLLELGDSSSDEGGDALALALEAHLAGYDISVERTKVSSLPPSPEELDNIGSSQMQGKDVLAYVWLDMDRMAIFILAEPRAEYRQLFERKLPISADAEPSDRNAIASAVRSTLSQWLEGDPPAAQDSTESGRPTANSDTQFEDAEEPPFMRNPAAEEPWEVPVVFGLAGYSFALSGGTAAFQHGPQLGLGLVIQNMFQFDMSVDLMRPVRASPQPENRSIELVQLPIKIMVGLVLPYEDFEFGLRLGIALVFFDVERADNGVWADKLDKTSVGFATSLFARWRFSDKVALSLDVNSNIFGSAYSYTEPESTEVNIYQSQVRWNISPGFAVFFN